MRLLLERGEYEAQGTGVFTESEYEALILDRKASIFPGWQVSEFKRPVDGFEGRRVPDLALIAPDFREWWVVEIEVSSHSLDRHVIPQVVAFREGFYARRHSDSLTAALHLESSDALDQLIHDVSPRIHVVVDQELPHWTSRLAAEGVTVSFVEIYRSIQDEFALRVSGAIPICRAPRRSRVVRQQYAPRAFKILNSAILDDQRDPVELRIDGRVTYWTRPIATGDMIVPVGADPFEGKNSFLIQCTSEGQLIGSHRFASD